MPEPEHNREYYKEQAQNKEQVRLEQIKKDEEKSQKDKQELVDHLDELRNRILITLGVISICSIIAFSYSGDIILFLEAAAPKGSKFFQLKPGELFMTSLKLSVYVALIVSLPVTLKQIEAFLKPGLKEKELKILAPIVNSAPWLIITGMLFAYYLVLPPLLEFLLNFREKVIDKTYGLEHFINLELMIITICGLCFLLPIVLFTLAALKIVNAKQLLAPWRYIVMAALIVSAVVTPTPDPLTMSILGSSLIFLYFATVWLIMLFKV